eukprot:scaffold70542_cov33-Tisochrysis_lutea.AAC.3
MTARTPCDSHDVGHRHEREGGAQETPAKHSRGARRVNVAVSAQQQCAECLCAERRLPSEHFLQDRRLRIAPCIAMLVEPIAGDTSSTRPSSQPTARHVLYEASKRREGQFLCKPYQGLRLCRAAVTPQQGQHQVVEECSRVVILERTEGSSDEAARGWLFAERREPRQQAAHDECRRGMASAASIAKCAREHQQGRL